MTKDYRVIWEIFINSASHIGAAREALKVQRDPNSTSNFFEVVEIKSGERRWVEIPEFSPDYLMIIEEAV